MEQQHSNFCYLLLKVNGPVHYFSSSLNLQFEVCEFLYTLSLCYAVILQLFSGGSAANSTRGRGEFDGSYQDPFSRFNKQNDDPFAEFYRENDGPFSNQFYKVFSEVIHTFPF